MVYESVDRSVQTKHYIAEATKRLQHMVRIGQLKKQMLLNVSLITDFSYAWKAIEEFIPILQGLIKNTPGTVLLLKTVYTKLASIMN